MNHPISTELVDFRRGTLPPDRTLEIEEHLKTCDSCSQEYEELKAIETHLGAWEDPQLSTAFVVDTMGLIRLDESIRGRQLRGSQPVGWRGNLWLRRGALAAGTVAVTILFQTFVWNPFGAPDSIRAVFRLTPVAYAITSGEAVPDTILVLTLNQDLYLSTPLLPGQFGFDELKDLASALDSLGETGQFRSLFVVGPDADNPVTFRTEMLQPLMDALGIDSISTGTGVVALENREEWTAWITPPLQMHAQLLNQSLLFNQTLLLNQLIVPSLETAMPLLTQSLLLNPLTLDISLDKWRWWRYSPTIRVTPSILKQRSMANLNVALLADLLSSSQAILTVNTDGNIIINRAVIPEYELRQALMRLRLLNPRISVLVLVREDAGTDDPGYRVKEIIERLGIRVSVLIIRDP